MLIREFVNESGQRYAVKEHKDGTLEVDFIPFSMRLKDWSFIDDMKVRGQIDYKCQYDLVNARY